MTYLKKNCFLMALLLTLSFLVFNCTNIPGGGGDPNPDVTGTVKFGVSNSTTRAGDATLDDAVSVLVSIEDAGGTLVYDNEEIVLHQFGTEFISEPLSLAVGSYNLTQFLVLDSTGDVIFATPLEGSAKAYLVSDPLPISFSVAKDTVTTINPEVLSVDGSTPEDFGYVSFNIDLVQTFDFLVGVFAYNGSALEMTDADMIIRSSGITIYSGTLSAITNSVTVRDGYTDYDITVSKTGYQDYTHTFTNSELKACFDNPLEIVLVEDSGSIDIDALDIIKTDINRLSNMRKMAFYNNYLYVVADQGGLQIYNFSDPANPVFVKAVVPEYMNTYGLYIYDNYAYFGSGGNLYIVDISNPEQAELVNTVTDLSNVKGIEVYGDYLYLAHGYEQFSILDISDKLNVQILGSIETTGYSRNLLLDGDYVYLCSDGDLFQIINVTDKSSPVVENTISISNSYDVAIKDNIAYVISQTISQSIKLVDISDPATASITDTFFISDYLYDIVISGDYAYVTGRDDGVQVIDLTTGQSVSSIMTYYEPADIILNENYAYVSDRYAGLQIMDISNPLSLSIVNKAYGSGTSSKAAVKDDYVYVANGIGGLQIIDASVPSSAKVVKDFIERGWNALSLALHNDYAFVGCTAGLQIIDISNPLSPALVSSTTTTAHILDVFVLDDYAYLALKNNDLIILNISDLQNPVAVSTYTTSSPVRGVFVMGDYAYLANDGDGLNIINVSDPANPASVSSIDTGSSAYGVFVRDQYAFAADYYNGLKIIDLSDIQNPSIAKSVDIYTFGAGVTVYGDYAFFANRDSGLKIVDISDIDTASVVKSFSTGKFTTNYCLDVKVSNNIVYAVDGTAGLVIIGE